MTHQKPCTICSSKQSRILSPKRPSPHHHYNQMELYSPSPTNDLIRLWNSSTSNETPHLWQIHEEKILHFCHNNYNSHIMILLYTPRLHIPNPLSWKGLIKKHKGIITSKEMEQWGNKRWISQYYGWEFPIWMKEIAKAEHTLSNLTVQS